MNNRMPVIVLSGFERRPRTGPYSRGTQAFAIAFVYSSKGNFVVKGMYQEVENYIKQHYPRSIYNLTLWADGKSRNIWYSNSRVYVSHREIKGHLKYEISVYSNGKRIHVFSVRRVPHKWLDIYNDADPE
jgi:hypothetical protein